MTSHLLHCPCIACIRKERPDVFLPLRVERMPYVDTPWAADALCATVDPELHFPEKGQSTQPAKAVCRKCSVVAPCLEFALAMDPPAFGIWAGTTERERRRMGRRTA